MYQGCRTPDAAGLLWSRQSLSHRFSQLASRVIARGCCQRLIAWLAKRIIIMNARTVGGWRVRVEPIVDEEMDGLRLGSRLFRIDKELVRMIRITIAVLRSSR